MLATYMRRMRSNNLEIRQFFLIYDTLGIVPALLYCF